MKIIAEAAINWDSLEEAKQIIFECKKLNLFLCKFQLYNIQNIVNPEHKKFCMERMLDYDKAKELFDYGQEIGQEVFFTVDYPEAVAICERIGVKWYKVRHYDRKNVELLNKIEQTKKPTFISVSLEDLKDYDVLLWEEFNLFPLYCIPKYPAQIEDYKIIALGMSDHTPDTQLLQLAKKMGCVYFERHICLDGHKETCLEREWVSEFSEIKEAIKD